MPIMPKGGGVVKERLSLPISLLSLIRLQLHCPLPKPPLVPVALITSIAGLKGQPLKRIPVKTLLLFNPCNGASPCTAKVKHSLLSRCYINREKLRLPLHLDIFSVQPEPKDIPLYTFLM